VCPPSEAVPAAVALAPVAPPISLPLAPAGARATAPASKKSRVFWILPNNRIEDLGVNLAPISARQKFKLAGLDTLDPGSALLAALFAAEGQLSHSQPAYGQGAAGYARYFGAAMSDVAIGNVLSGAVYPALFHQDPRYFRLGTGSAWTRVKYAMSRVIWTRTDNGRKQFNYSEFLGNATATAIGTAYYVDSRSAHQAAERFSFQIGIDAGGNVLAEFWPDIQRKFFHTSHP
jgi:hypothetical protein